MFFFSAGWSLLGGCLASVYTLDIRNSGGVADTTFDTITSHVYSRK